MLIVGFAATGWGDPPVVALSFLDPKGQRLTGTDAPIEVGSLGKLRFLFDHTLPAGIKVSNQGSAYQITVARAFHGSTASVTKDEPVVHLRAIVGDPLYASDFTLTRSGGTGITYATKDHLLHVISILELKIPTDRDVRIARIRSMYDKILAGGQDPAGSPPPGFLKTLKPEQLTAIITGMADSLVENKPGTYTIGATLRDPLDGKELTSNSVTFKIVGQGYPFPLR